MRLIPASSALLLAAMVPAGSIAQETKPTPASIIAAAPAADWKAIDPADLLVMTLAPDPAGHPRTVTIQLMPPPLSQPWVGNIRTLAQAHWWDGTTVYRVVDNWVAQWGDGEDPSRTAKPLPSGLTIAQPSEYVVAGDIGAISKLGLSNGVRADSYADRVGWAAGFAVAGDGTDLWPIHCYGSVGVARDLAPDTGTGAELYTVIGHAPRQLDRNIAVVGRVIEGIEHLSVLPRGKGEAGVYDDDALRVPIQSVRMGTELAAPPRFEYLDPEGPSFAEYLRVAASRDDPFYQTAARGIDICNAKVPIRRTQA